MKSGASLVGRRSLGLRRPRRAGRGTNVAADEEANNVFVFPGVGLGAILSEIEQIDEAIS